MRFANGDYTNLGKYIGGASTSVGEMIPSMLIGRGVGGILTKAGVSAATAGTIASGTAQATFYTGMFSGTVKDMYRQFQVMGADVDSSSIVANAAIKSALQWGVEKTLGKMLGATSIDNLAFGRAQNAVGAKIGGWRAVGHILKDAGQEGLEEVLQDTSDFLVNEGFSNFIDAYGVNNEISFQSLLDAFTIGAIVSIAGSAVDVLKTRRVIGGDGKKLGKLASWEYGINMDSFARNVAEVMEKAGKVNYETDNRKKNLIQGAALETYASYRLVTSIYEEIGDERFKAANEVLNKITEQIQSGKFNKEDVTSYVENMREQFSHLSNLALEKMVPELEKKNVKEVKRSITADDTKTTKKGTEPKEKLTPKEARDKLEELFEDSGAETVTETDGNVEVEKDGYIVISSDRLNNESINEILQNLSVQNLVSHLSELSNKEQVRDNLSKTYEEYYGKTASEDADVISLLFDADFFKAVLMKSNKDVFKYLSYFAEAEKNLVRGKRRDEIYRNKINEIRDHWFNHLADYCIIHEEANPTMFLNYISDVKKRKEIENKVKKGRWGTDIYNRVLLSESNLDKLSENEKIVLRTRFDNAFAKSIATRHWNNVNSNNAAARQQSMNALSNKYQGLFSSKYDGVTYMPDISIGNRVFNKFMQSLGLDLSTLLNKNYLTESDVKLITDDYGKVDENSILNFRKAQFKEMSTVYDFTINKSGHFEVSHKGKIVGFSKYRKLQKDIEEGKKADTFVTDTKVKSDRLSKLINTDLITTSASYYTIDDVITNPELLKPEVANEIVKFANDKYGLKLTRPTADTTFLYLRNYFLSEFKDMTIVMSNDGEFVFASVKKIVDLFKNPNIKITKDTKLSDIIKDKYLPEGLKLKFVEGWDSAQYVPYKNVDKDGVSITTFDNTIYIGDGIFADGDDYVRFVFAHEFQHALQFINNINAGADSKWISNISDKQRKEIISDVRKHKPELFKNVKVGSEIESSIVNDYVYHSTGETDAYGLQGNDVLDFVPVVSKNDRNVLTFIMPWGTVHKIKNVKKADVISSIWKKEADNLWRFTDLKDLYSLNVNDDIYIREEVKLKEYGELMPQLDKLEYQTEYGYYLNRWLSRPLNTDGFISEDWKKIIKENLTSEQKTDSIKRLHRVIAPNVPFDEFINTDINFVRLQSRGFLADSPFVSIYANPSIDNAHKLLEYACTKSRQHKVSVNSYIIAGAFKPKDLLFYFPTQNNEVLIEPSKLIGSKFYKMNNDIVIVDSNGKEVDSFTESWRFVAISNHSNRILFEPSLDEENGNTYLVGADMSENKTVKIPIKKGEYTLRYFGDDLTLDKIVELSKNKEKSFYEEFPIATTKYGSISFDNTKRSAFYIDNFDTLERIESNSLEDRASVNVRITDPNGRVITPEETETSLAELESLYGMSLKRTPKKYLKEDDPRAKDFISRVANPNHQYKERLYELNEDGTQKLDKQGKPIYHYVPSEKKSRYVSKRKYAGTNLQYFVKSYSPTTMSPELQKFILNAKDLDPVLQNKIDGKEKGTLTQKYVFDYLRSKNKIDDNTFKQINDAFFQNKYIKTFDELQHKIDHSMRESWAIYRMFKLDEKLKRNMILLETDGVDFDYVYELIERNEYYAKMYANLLVEFDEYNKKSFEVEDSYARMRYMRHYDGTIKSEREVSSVVRLIAMLNWNTTKKTNEFDITDAYADVVESLDLSKTEMIEAIQSREASKWGKEGRSYEDVLEDITELGEKLYGMSVDEIRKLYTDKENTVENVIIEGLVADADGNYLYISPDVPKVTSSHLVNRMKGKIRYLKRILTPKEIAKSVEDNSDIFRKDLSVNNELYQNKIRNKTRDGYHYENKSVEEVQEVFDKVAGICDRVREEKSIGKANVDARDKQIKELQRKIKQLERDKKNQKSDKIPKVHEIIVEGETLQIETNKEIPLSLLKILQVHYNKTAKSSVQNLSSDNKRHIKMVSETFLEENADNFNNLTQADVDEIIDFYLTTDVAFNNATTPYQLAEIWTLTYLVKQGRNGNPNFVIDNDKLRKIEHLLESIIKRSATNLSTWRSALKELNPEAVIANAMARKIGIEVSEEDVERIIDAIDTKDMEKVEKVKGDIYRKLLKERKQSKTDFLDKVLQYERLAMLSGPGTWVRNQASNAVIAGVNKLSDGMSGKLEKVLNKLFPKSQYIESQYKIAGTKVTDEVSNYIANNLINNGLLDIVIDSLSKYDVRKPTIGQDSSAVLADMIAGSIKQQFQRQPLFKNDKAQKVEKFLLKMISDDRSVKKAALGYLGKMITEDLETGRIKAKVEVLSQNRISKHFMTYVAEAFKLASYDYMHKPNFFFNLESQIAKKSKGAYFMYKQVFPFVGASWNWFVEGLKYSPVGLAKAIVNYAKLENTIDKYERKRQTFEYGDIGVSSDFAKYLTIRDINKGVIGSVGMLIGILLATLGVAKIDEDDDKYKLFVGDARIDISDVFGTQGIFLGMAITSNIIDEDADIVDTFSAALDQMFIDSTFADFFNTFRYSQNLGDWITYQPISMLNMNIPNFLKTVTSLSTPYQVKYSDGLLGKIEKLAVSAIPGLSYAFPHYYDPYTGEKQVAQKAWFLTKAIDRLTPLGLSVYNVTDMERLAIEQGIHKNQLTGRYEIDDTKIRLKAKDVERLNQFYGQRNSADLKELQSNSKTYKVKQANGTFKNLRWSQMTDKEKATIIDRIMTDNSGYAKIFILTDSGDYKYFATDSEFSALRALGITKNIYRKNNKYSGFVKAS